MPKLLIVDDELDVREFAKNFFRKRGIDVFTAGGGYEALDIIQAEHPDLLLLDVRMDEINGVEMLRRLRGGGNDVKVIMVTGVQDDEVIQEAKELGICGYIHKPLVLDELEDIVLREINQMQE